MFAAASSRRTWWFGRAMGAYTWASAFGVQTSSPKATVVSVNLGPGDTGSVTPWPL